MASTYEPIATTTLSSNSSTITFSSIPQTYTDLVAAFVGYAENSNDPGGMSSWGFTLNGDTNTNYSNTFIYGNGSSAGSSRHSNYTYNNAGQINGTNIGNSTFHFMNYSNSSTYKTILVRNSIGTNGVTAYVGLWRNTAAVSSITFGYFDGGGYFYAGAQLTLYGIKAA